MLRKGVSAWSKLNGLEAGRLPQAHGYAALATPTRNPSPPDPGPRSPLAGDPGLPRCTRLSAACSAADEPRKSAANDGRGSIADAAVRFESSAKVLQQKQRAAPVGADRT